MQVSTITLDEMCELLGDQSTHEDAEAMIELLIERGVEDTDDVSDAEWFSLLSKI